MFQKWRLEELKGQLPYVSCKMRQYNSSDIKICLDKRKNDKNFNGMRISYIGDSRIRQHLEILIDLVKPLNPKIQTSEV